ncbi:class I tRNA ligase family protein [Candidatus Gracilibacteria bacterium]|nr:class I tRNA ligase family protein [Candidatus Gracilibacteria bacterium]
MFPKVNPKQSFPEMEEKILAFWKENNTFQKSIDQRPKDNPYRFYDGPPFITGTPHYGSLLSSIVKDIVPRYHTMQGKRVERKWGWDCHGLPIEEKVQKKLGLKSNRDIEEHGVKNFIDECYTYTRETSAEWDWYIDHIGRWVDTDNAYRTMDQDYMESVMWVFKQMHEKGKVYKGQRVSLYSWKLSTPISNFEVAMDDSYEEVSDPAVTVMFPITDLSPTLSSKEREQAAASFPSQGKEFKIEVSKSKVQIGDYIIAWTTTPWTIPAHMSMALNKNLSYSRVSSEGNYYILATARVETVFKGREFEIIDSFLGEDLIGLKYTPPFNFYVGKVDADKNHKILHADFITDTDGTGIGHQAPEFGEVDFQLAQKEGVHISAALDDTGCYTEEIEDYVGMHYQDANDVVSEKLKELGLLFKKESINHRVAMCPRSGTKLIYKAQDSWFINIQEMKDRLLAENEGINWQPKHLKHGQFLKSVESAPDWCISRTRYWGTPMPIWMGTDSEGNEVDMKVFGNKQEIYDASSASKKLTKIIFVRHGNTDYNEKHIIDVVGKAELNSKGLEHAQNVLTGLEDEKIDVIYSSPLKRCLDTISPLADNKNIDVQTSESAIEFQALSCQDKPSSQLHEGKISLGNSAIKGDETIEVLLERSKKFLNEVIEKNEGKTIVICSHYYTIAGFLQSIHNFDWNSEVRSWAPTNQLDNPKYKPYISELLFTDSKKPLDLHRPYIDDITWKEGNITYTRLPEVLDVWMDSASMPYAQMHYPFENKTAMESSFPADFIVEYIGQVRAWFYVMHVIGVALFDTRAFTNVITTGIVMGSDGKKMSKSLGNYPDPRGTIQKYGADAIRFYMANSPLLTGGNMDFKEEGILEVVKKVILPLWNTYSFFTTYANIDGFKAHTTPLSNSLQSGERTDGNDEASFPLEGKEFKIEVSGGEKLTRNNPLDTWIISETHTLIAEVTSGMENYEVTDATRPIVKFMDKLTNWYIRRSRKRFWKSENDGDKIEAYETLYEVLVTLSQVIAPFMPFVAEEIYKNLTGETSVHLTDFPKADSSLIDTSLNEDMDLCQKIINLGLSLRTAQKIRVRQPLQSISIGENLSEYYKEIIKEELNVKEVSEADSQSIAKKICKPNGRLIGPKFGKEVKNIITQAKLGNFEEVDENTVKVGEFTLEGDEFEMAFVTEGESNNIESGFGMVIAMNLEITPELQVEGQARDIVRHIQEARKEAGYQVDDRIRVNILTENIESILSSYDIASETLSTIDTTLLSGDLEKEIELGNTTAKIILKK